MLCISPSTNWYTNRTCIFSVLLSFNGLLWCSNTCIALQVAANGKKSYISVCFSPAVTRKSGHVTNLVTPFPTSSLPIISCTFSTMVELDKKKYIYMKEMVIVPPHVLTDSQHYCYHILPDIQTTSSSRSATCSSVVQLFSYFITVYLPPYWHFEIWQGYFASFI